MKRLLLISSSRTHGTGFLEHCEAAIQHRLAGVSQVLFIPYALHDQDSYAEIAEAAFERMNLQLHSIHTDKAPLAAVAEAEAIFVGGGNSFRLLNCLYEHGLLSAIQERVLQGMPYLGSSAGTNMACPTIRTSNDMPIVQPPSFEALNLVPFQINPHFIDANPKSTHQGETREQRLAEYLEENETPVLGLREGSWFMIDEDECHLGGCGGAVMFCQGEPPRELPQNTRLNISGRISLIEPTAS